MGKRFRVKYLSQVIEYDLEECPQLADHDVQRLVEEHWKRMEQLAFDKIRGSKRRAQLKEG